MYNIYMHDELGKRQAIEFESQPHELPPLATEIHASEVQICEEDYDRFMSVFCENEEDEALIGKILSNMRVITREKFLQGVERIKGDISDFVGEDPYYLLVDHPGKSGDLMLDLLGEIEPEPIDILRKKGSKEKLSADVKGAKVVIVDDVGYSGDTLMAFGRKAESDVETQPQDIMIATVGMTSKAINRATEAGYTVAYSYDIPMISEILTLEEIDQYSERLKTLMRDSGYSGYETKVLTSLYYKVPDNYLQGLRRMRCILIDNGGEHYDEVYLLDDDEGIFPPYWNRN